MTSPLSFCPNSQNPCNFSQPCITTTQSSSSILSEADRNHCQLVIAEDYADIRSSSPLITRDLDSDAAFCAPPNKLALVAVPEKSLIHTVEALVKDANPLDSEKSVKNDLCNKSSGLDDILNSIANYKWNESKTLSTSNDDVDMCSRPITITTTGTTTSALPTSTSELVQELDLHQSHNNGTNETPARPSRPLSTPPKLLHTTNHHDKNSNCSTSTLISSTLHGDLYRRNKNISNTDSRSVCSLPVTSSENTKRNNETKALKQINETIVVKAENKSLACPAEPIGQQQPPQSTTLPPYKSMLSALEEDIDAANFTLDASNYVNATATNSLVSTLNQVVSSQSQVSSVSQEPIRKEPFNSIEINYNSIEMTETDTILSCINAITNTTTTSNTTVSTTITNPIPVTVMASPISSNHQHYQLPISTLVPNLYETPLVKVARRSYQPSKRNGNQRKSTTNSIPLRGRPPLSFRPSVPSSPLHHPSSLTDVSYTASLPQFSFSASLPQFSSSKTNFSLKSTPSLPSTTFNGATPQSAPPPPPALGLAHPSAYNYYRPIAPAANNGSQLNGIQTAYLAPTLPSLNTFPATSSISLQQISSTPQPMPITVAAAATSAIQSTVFGLRRTQTGCWHSPGKRANDSLPSAIHGIGRMPTAVVSPWNSLYSSSTENIDQVHNATSASHISNNISQQPPLGRVGIRKKIPSSHFHMPVTKVNHASMTSNTNATLSNVNHENTPVMRTPVTESAESITANNHPLLIHPTPSDDNNIEAHSPSPPQENRPRNQKRKRRSGGGIRRSRAKPRKSNVKNKSFSPVAVVVADGGGVGGKTSQSSIEKEKATATQESSRNSSNIMNDTLITPTPTPDYNINTSIKTTTLLTESSHPRRNTMGMMTRSKSLLLEQMGSSVSRQELVALLRKEDEDAMNDGFKRSVRSHMIGGQIIYESNKPFPALHGRELVLALLGHINIDDAPEVTDQMPSSPTDVARSPSPANVELNVDKAAAEEEAAQSQASVKVQSQQPAVVLGENKTTLSSIVSKALVENDETTDNSASPTVPVVPPSPPPSTPTPALTSPPVVSVASSTAPVPVGVGLLRRTQLPEPKDKPLRQWSVDEVYKFVSSLPGCECNNVGNGSIASPFRNNEIDGEALSLLNEDNLLEPPLSMKLGPALKLHALIQYLLRNEKKQQQQQLCASAATATVTLAPTTTTSTSATVSINNNNNNNNSALTIIKDHKLLQESPSSSITHCPNDHPLVSRIGQSCYNNK